MIMIFFLVSVIFSHYERIYAFELTKDKEKKPIILTTSMDILFSTNINSECENKDIIFRYIYDEEQIKEIESIIMENDIDKIIYITTDDDSNKTFIEMITKSISNQITVEIFKVFNYDAIGELLSRYTNKEKERENEISINVINRDEASRYYIYKEANTANGNIGFIYGNLSEVKILGKEKEFYKVQAIRYSDKKDVIGYIPIKDIKTRQLNSKYNVIVSIEDQVISVFYENELIREIICSSGKKWYETPKGRFIIGRRGHSFGSSTYTCYNWVRFNNNYLFHSVLYNKNGTVNEYEYKKLGTPASHGCIRMPLDDSKWFYDNIPEETLVTIK
ncbi:L,D-transpeptidase [Oceanirhabdus sp. W0125-5]|uniref:L,D-transpeptidase n=1 Tax=Oceanirhabdus sp. W0125-5 TaxID=2999116 RepID=UPI0022F2F297|nr:L,D-transpeptidase [Oceanirhabdus sp. W0125-5]WBW97498.1 L,D-transpeptidase [Oceanirhabdus sp. W0125-5]